jgi:hypothetical protein
MIQVYMSNCYLTKTLVRNIRAEGLCGRRSLSASSATMTYPGHLSQILFFAVFSNTS